MSSTVQDISSSRGTRVVVTGGAGFVGSHVVDLLAAAGYDVLVIDDLSTGRRTNLGEAARFAALDIGSTAATEAMRDFAPAAVVHLAAQPSVPRSFADPLADARTNILGGVNLAQAAAAACCRRFVYVTTGGALYGTPRYLPVDEAHPVEPQSPYGLSKWTLEQYLRLLPAPAMELSVLRLANVFGPRQNTLTEAGVVTAFAAHMLAGEPVTIHGDGEQTRDFVYVRDVASACRLALEAPEPFTANVSSATETSVNALFRTLARATDYRLAPVYGPARTGDIVRSCLDNRRLRALGWDPKMDLEEGLIETVAWLQAASRA